MTATRTTELRRRIQTVEQIIAKAQAVIAGAAAQKQAIMRRHLT